jgi:hypothetical protein
MNGIVGWSLILSAIWWGLQMGFVITFYVVGQPFGALSDLSNEMNVIFLLPLAVFLHAYSYPTQPVISVGSTVLGTAGVLSTALASFLILFGRISFEQSLPPIIFGFSAIGIWLALGFILLRIQAVLPPFLAAAGLVVGIGLASIGLLFLWGDAQAAFTTGAVWSNPAIYPVLLLTPVGYIGLPVWAVMTGRQILHMVPG